MADENNLVPGSASSRAHATAAAAISDPSFRTVARAFMANSADTDGAATGDLPDPADMEPEGASEDEPAPEVETAPETETEPGAEEAAPAEEDGDYDEETAAVYEEPEAVPAAPVAAKPKTDAEPTIEALSRQVEELTRRLEQGTAAPAGGSPKPEATHEALTDRQILETLIRDRADVREEVDTLARFKTATIEKQQEADKVRTEAADAALGVKVLQGQLARVKARQEREPENYALVEEVGALQRELDGAELKAERLDSKAERLAASAERDTNVFNARAARLTDLTAETRRHLGEQAKNEEQERAIRTETITTWKRELPAFCERHKIPANKTVTLQVDGKPQQYKLGDVLDKLLLMKARDTQGAIKNIGTWMNQQHDIIAMIQGLRGTGAEEYGDEKRRDVAVRAPKGRAAVASTKPQTARFDSKAADRAAGLALAKAFGGTR